MRIKPKIYVTLVNCHYRLLHYVRCANWGVADNCRTNILGRRRLRCKMGLFGAHYRFDTVVDRHSVDNSRFLFDVVMKIPGLSFSLKRAVGISGLKTKIARKVGIPTTKQGLERKIGGAILKGVFGKKKSK